MVVFKQKKKRLPKKKPSASQDAEGGKALFLFAGRGNLGSQRGKEGGKPGGFGGQILHQYPSVINTADDPAFIIKDVFPHHGTAANPFHRAELCPKGSKLLLGGHGAASFQATVVPG